MLGRRPAADSSRFADNRRRPFSLMRAAWLNRCQRTRSLKQWESKDPRAGGGMCVVCTGTSKRPHGVVGGPRRSQEAPGEVPGGPRRAKIVGSAEGCGGAKPPSPSPPSGGIVKKPFGSKQARLICSGDWAGATPVENLRSRRSQEAPGGPRRPRERSQ